MHNPRNVSGATLHQWGSTLHQYWVNPAPDLVQPCTTKIGLNWSGLSSFKDFPLWGVQFEGQCPPEGDGRKPADSPDGDRTQGNPFGVPVTGTDCPPGGYAPPTPVDAAAPYAAGGRTS